MRLLSGLCFKLQHTAAVFLQLAQSHICHDKSIYFQKGADDITQQLKASGPGEEAAESQNNLIDLVLGDHDLTNYLNCLPLEMNDTSQILETEFQVPKSHIFHLGEEDNPPYPQRPISDRTFDWFLWDDYYGSSNVGHE